MPSKKASAIGAAALQPLDPNQETLSLREARSQKRKATSPTPQEDELDQEIRNMEMLHQQVQKKKEKMARLADLQRQIDEATEEVRHLAQDEQERRPQHRELHQEGLFDDDGWYDDSHHGNFAFDDASPLSIELQATPWPPSYKPPQLPMYDGHSDPKQFLMSYEATISSYEGNTAVMAKSFVMAVKNVAQTWYSSLWPGTITSWQKLKDMLITSFQGFQTKSVTAQALFQCTQDHEEYLQAYVRRFLRLRAQAPTVPNEIVIEAMIKGLRPGPSAQYFARKPPQTLEKLLHKMDEYIHADNDFRQRREEAYRFSEMTRASEAGFTQGTLDQSTLLRMTTEEVSSRGRNIPPRLRGSNKVILGLQLQGAEVPGASVEGLGIGPGKFIAYSAVRTRAILQGCAMSPSRNRRR
jgi:hypothetical protein